MNDWLLHWGIEAWKPWLQLMVIPPVPLLLLALLAWLLVRRHPRLARATGVLAVLGLWVFSTPWAAYQLRHHLTRPPPVLTEVAIAGLAGQPRTAVVVLGAGRRVDATEYGGPDLRPLGLERLRYGAWLARRTRLPLAYSGGVGHGAASGPTEAEAARQALARDQGPPLRWAEDRSRDTAENARYSVALLQADGIERIVLVTHDFHQQRALAAFQRAIARSGRPVAVVAAPMGMLPVPSGQLSDYLPSGASLQHSAWALHEWLGWLSGA